MRLQVAETLELGAGVLGARSGGAFGQTTPRASMIHYRPLYTMCQRYSSVLGRFFAVRATGKKPTAIHRKPWRPRSPIFPPRCKAKRQTKDYAATQAALETWAVAPPELIAWCAKHRVHHALADRQLRLIERAANAGKGQRDLAYLYELLKQGAD